MGAIEYLYIGLGSAFGAIFRTLISRVLPDVIIGIPAKILCVNVLGCFVMGGIAEFMALHWSTSNSIRSFLVPGFLGGFTTFSAFALDFGLLYQKHLYGYALLYALSTFTLTLVGFFGGMKLVRILS